MGGEEEKRTRLGVRAASMWLGDFQSLSCRRHVTHALYFIPTLSSMSNSSRYSSTSPRFCSSSTSALGKGQAKLLLPLLHARNMGILRRKMTSKY